MLYLFCILEMVQNQLVDEGIQDYLQKYSELSKRKLGEKNKSFVLWKAKTSKGINLLIAFCKYTQIRI